jgi:predicted TIM-barrel fold metal-dependent hydrolase
MFDAHCHAWEHWPYDTSVPDPESRGSIESLLYEMDTHGVERAAVVCARIGGGRGGDGYANAGNNGYVASFAAGHPDRITAWVDVDCSWSDEYHTDGALERLIRETEPDVVTGFTHYFREENDGWLLTDAAGEFFAHAADRGLVASLAVGAAWHDDLRELARRHPTLAILVHHLGTPRSDADAESLLALAGSPTIGVKVSGFNYNSSSAWDYPYPDSQAWFRRVAAAFGADRLYWGSDSPASRDQLTYRQSIEVVREHASFLSPHELDAVMGGNLERLVADSRR